MSEQNLKEIYSQSIEALYAEKQTSAQGLSADAAAQALQKYGPNELEIGRASCRERV